MIKGETPALLRPVQTKPLQILFNKIQRLIPKLLLLDHIHFL